jgi:hypothetical protein
MQLDSRLSAVTAIVNAVAATILMCYACVAGSVNGEES